jgi:hypothetical protein
MFERVSYRVRPDPRKQAAEDEVSVMNSIRIIFDIFKTDLCILSKRTLLPQCPSLLCTFVCVCLFVCVCTFVARTEKRVLTPFDDRNDAMPESSTLDPEHRALVRGPQRKGTRQTRASGALWTGTSTTEVMIIPKWITVQITCLMMQVCCSV